MAYDDWKLATPPYDDDLADEAPEWEDGDEFPGPPGPPVCRDCAGPIVDREGDRCPACDEIRELLNAEATRFLGSWGEL